MSLIKAILVGAYGLFLESIITRLNKEACETFVITGSKIKEAKKHSDVIEEYHFEYDNDNIRYVLESTKADTVIFSGALDTRFTWNKQKDAVTYIGGLSNILISAAKVGVKRFIYLSTTDVYDKGTSGFIQETSPANPTDFRTMTIKNGEEMALHYHSKGGMEVIVLRCSEVFGFVNDKINMNSFCTKLCIDIFDEKAYIDSNQLHDYIYIADVVEAVYTTMRQESIPHNVYNICSGISMTENQTFQAISKLCGNTNDVKLMGDSSESDGIYSNELAKEELGFFLMNSFEESFNIFFENFENYTLSEKSQGIRHRYFRHLRKNAQSIFGWLFPYIETIVAFIIIQAVVLVTSGSPYMEAIDLYLLFVVFIAIIYGKGQTIIALLLSFISKIIFLEQDVSINSIVVDYNTYLWMLQMLMIGMGVGYVRDRYKQSIDDKEEDIKYYEDELEEIKEINHSNIRIKKIYENRLINYKDSFARIYSIVTKLDDLEPDKIVFAAVNVVSQIMESEEVVIYNVSKGSSYARLVASSTNSVHATKKSIKLDSLEDVYDEINKHKIYINRTLNSNKPVMAGGVFHDNNLETIVIIWSLPFESTTLYHMNLFSVVLNLITQAMHRARYHIEESQSERYIEDTNILNEKNFKKIEKIQQHGSDTKLAEYIRLEIVQSDKSYKILNDLMTPILRQHDYLGIGEDGKLYLLLTNTNENESEYVVNRLAHKGIAIRKDVVDIDRK